VARKVRPARTATLQDKAAVRLGNGETNRATAKGLGVAEWTVSRWRRDPDFVEQIDRERELAIRSDREWLAKIRQETFLQTNRILAGDIPDLSKEQWAKLVVQIFKTQVAPPNGTLQINAENLTATNTKNVAMFVDVKPEAPPKKRSA